LRVEYESRFWLLIEVTHKPNEFQMAIRIILVYFYHHHHQWWWMGIIR
jgi:hypothetical protein